jgi:hypothetical protein
VTEPQLTVKNILGGLTPGQLWGALVIVFSVLSAVFGLGVRLGPVLKGTQQASVGAQTTKSPAYVQDAEEFIDTASLKDRRYQYDGYIADLNKLDRFAQDFLSSMKNNPVHYSDAQIFYRDMDRAAGVVTWKAFNNFVSPGEVLQEKLNYNWNVYAIPSKFRICLQTVEEKHKSNHDTLLSTQQIEQFQGDFDNWRKEVHVQ